MIPLTAQGATWTQTTDTDFNSGTLNGVEVVGSGIPAYVQLAREGTDWTDEAPATDPGPREGPAMAYDATNDVVVLFGGYDAGYLGDTWEYNPSANDWAQTSSSGPSNRTDAGIAYDSTNNIVVLFGGLADLGYENDTWEYDASTDTWTNTTSALSPPILGSYAMAYDSTAGRTIVVGLDFVSQTTMTWAYDASTNTWANRAPPSRPGPRTNHAVAYDAGLNRVVLFAGFNPFPPPGTTLGDTWEYNYAANSWTQTVPDGSGAPSRFSHGLTYRSSRSSVFLFGGSSGIPLSDTWRYFDDAGTRTWSNVFTQTAPPGRSKFGFTDERSDGRSFVFGGRLAGGPPPASDTWSLGPAFTGQGNLESATFDSGGANADWQTISWLPTSQPAGTTLRFQVASNNDPGASWTFVGPDGQPTSYYTSSGATIAGHDGNRYFRYRAYMTTTDVLVSPTLDELTITYDVPPASPYIITQSPRFAGNPVTSPIFVRFSEEMNITTVGWTIDPALTVTPDWTEGNSALTLNHTGLLECTQYTVTITGEDLDGNALVPGPLPNPWTFVTQCINPTITSTQPIQGATDVPLNAPIVVDFSEPMDTGTVTWDLSPSVTLADAWSNGDTRLTLTHTTDFQQCTVHTVTITGEDLAGLPLLPAAVPNPWTFTAVCTIPFVVTTSPLHLQTGVAVDAPIVVTFSETMNNATVEWSISPAVVVSPVWSNANGTLTLNHTADLAGCTPYTVDITRAKDMDGNDLIPGRYDGFAPHPWKFQTVCPNPFLVFTVPADGDTNVDLFANIEVQFSESMNTASVSVTILPAITLTQNWVAGSSDTLLRLNHTEPFACGTNTVQISGEDVGGNPLVDGLAPNPWSFTPFCPNPFILATDPADSVTDVPLDARIVVTFSEPMDIANVTWTLIPDTPLTVESWTGGNTVLTLTHASLFPELTDHTVIVDGMDTEGNPLVPGPVPNPWRFTTAAIQPYIVSTDPAEGASNVPVTASVTIVFSEPMDTVTVVATPTPFVSLSYFWSAGNTTLIVIPVSLFAECTAYSFLVTGNDTQGRPLAPGPVPNPWSFSTVCTRPSIVSTNPASGATEVANGAAVVVTFSEPMDIGTVGWTISPSIGLSDGWTGGNTVLTLSHTTPFAQCTAYTVTISGNDTEGKPLIAGPVPNPWTFTSFTCNAPFIVSTDPSAGEMGVPMTASIVVEFNAPMDVGTVTPTIGPPVALSPGWSNGNRTLTLTPNPGLAECTPYTASIAGQGENGLALGPGSVPNPWTFTTVCPASPPGGLFLSRVPPTVVRLQWNAAPNADSYRIFESQNRFAPWPWAVLGTTTGTTFDAPHLADGFPHYYIVRSVRSGTESSNSTMGAKAQVSIGYNAAGANTFWVSLPYRSGYVTASDISTELTAARINVVGKWDPARQTSVLWYQFRGQWRGTNFPINPGDGLWVGSVSAFSWSIVGTDRAVPLTFTLNGAPLGNVNWISLPFTSTYSRASHLVLDIEGSLGPGANTRIVEVAKWDGASQSLVRYFWTTTGWSGTDFTIASGEGVYFRIVSSFSWQPSLVTPEVP